MPIHEYTCRACGHAFELLVLARTTLACPACESRELERQLSVFAVNSPETSQARITAARDAMKQSKSYKDKQVAESEHVREHMKHRH